MPLDIAGLAGVGDGLAGGAPLVAVVDHSLAEWLRCGKVHCQRDYDDSIVQHIRLGSQTGLMVVTERAAGGMALTRRMGFCR